MRLIHGECIEEMNKLIDEKIKVDLILTDPPYGTIKGIKLKGWSDNTTKWDNQLPLKTIFECSEKLLRMGGTLILFSNEPYTCYLRSHNCSNLPFTYPLYWFKDHFANNLSCYNAPVSYVEDISVFRKKYDTDNTHPLRKYAQNLLDEMGMSYKEIENQLGHRKAEHFFYRTGSSQFGLCTEETYNELIDVFNINECDCFMEYGELILINEKFKPTFNLPNNAKYKSNILQYKKSYNRFHPTEKPVDLLEDLIRTYTNNGDLVLDFTMGSGSTGVACQNTGRDFIGIELNEDYYNIAKERCNNSQTKLEVN